MVPRCMEARGLDVTPAIINKFKNHSDDASVALLTRILNDEVGHVERGRVQHVPLHHLESELIVLHLHHHYDF